MDTDKHVYFAALGARKLRESELAVQGVDAHGGLISSVHDRIADSLWLADQSGHRRIAGKVGLMHEQGVGNILTLREQQISTFPCLLTTDSGMRWVFSGTVNVVANDSAFDLREDFPASGVPLCGDSWFGLLRLMDNECWLDAYSIGGEQLRDPVMAFSPEWAEGFDDLDAPIFTIARKVSGTNGTVIRNPFHVQRLAS